MRRLQPRQSSPMGVLWEKQWAFRGIPENASMVDRDTRARAFSKSSGQWVLSCPRLPLTTRASFRFRLFSSSIHRSSEEQRWRLGPLSLSLLGLWPGDGLRAEAVVTSPDPGDLSSASLFSPPAWLVGLQPP